MLSKHVSYLLLFFSVVLVFPVRCVPAPVGVTVDEKATRLMLLPGERRVDVVLHNPHVHVVPVRAQVDLVDPDDRVRATAHAEQRLKSGRHRVLLSLSDAPTPANRPGELLWYRLQYRVESPSDPPVTGVIAVSEVMPHLFEIRVAAPRHLRPGPTPVRVQAAHPVSGRGVAGVSLEGDVSYEGGGRERRLVARGVTGSDGIATPEARAQPCESTQAAIPGYPLLPSGGRASGEVQVEATVGPSGDVLDAKAISGPERLRGAAEGAARKWQFDGQHGDFHKCRITFAFILRPGLGTPPVISGLLMTANRVEVFAEERRTVILADPAFEDVDKARQRKRPQGSDGTTN